MKVWFHPSSNCGSACAIDVLAVAVVVVIFAMATKMESAQV